LHVPEWLPLPAGSGAFPEEVKAAAAQPPSKKVSRVSLHESQNITHHFVKEEQPAEEQRMPSMLEMLQAQQAQVGVAEAEGSEEDETEDCEGAQEQTRPEAAHAVAGADGLRDVLGMPQLDFDGAAAVTAMPSMMDMLQAQLGAAASGIDTRLSSGIEVDDATKEVLSQMLDESRITVNTPPLDFFAAAGPPFSLSSSALALYTHDSHHSWSVFRHFDSCSMLHHTLFTSFCMGLLFILDVLTHVCAAVGHLFSRHALDRVEHRWFKQLAWLKPPLVDRRKGSAWAAKLRRSLL
jgi:hypothetical protein